MEAEIDPKGLIRESFRIEGIGLAECRSILVDWAISLPPGQEARDAIPRLLDLYAAPPDHPMTQVLREGLAEPASGGRRGGRRGRTGG